jgi:SPOR domain
MRKLPLAVLCLISASSPSLAGPPLEAADPLGPCLAGKPAPDDIDKPSAPWGVQVAAAFSRQGALDAFAAAKKQYADILNGYSPTVLADCDLNMGTALRYSARVVFDDRGAADTLCDKLQAAGGACIVMKN